jgi:hypothetical protein
VISWMRRCWNDNVSYEGGISLIYMNGLLLIPFAMAAFFYPVGALIAAAVVLLLSFAVYESCVIWKRHHTPHKRA